jgi:hypothetical protein
MVYEGCGVMKKSNLAVGLATATVVGASVYAGIKLIKRWQAKKTMTLISETKIISLEFPSFETLKALYNESKIVVRGKILNTEVREIQVGKHEDGEPIEYLYTVSKVIVSKAIKGSAKEGDIIFVKQLGDGQKVIASGFEEDMYFKPQEEYYLFLSTFGRDSSSMPYSCVNPKQGCFKVNSGIISSEHINVTIGTADIVKIRKEGMTVAEFERELALYNEQLTMNN